MPLPPIRDSAEPRHYPALPMHYQVRQRLGEGGYGEVFEVWDDKLRRSVAVKHLKHRGDATPSARLIEEARLAASLHHAAFVKIYALEESQESQSIVMELVRGQTLKQLLAQTPPGERQALAIIGQIAEAMREAHDSGLVHGDLKPSNVMVESSGTARILDFGLAAQADAQATASLQQTDPQGTLAYLAPERLLGQPLRPQSDIYALGVILYELLTGARPFAGLDGLALAAALMQSSADAWPYPRDMRPALIALVRDMAAKLPERRLSSMREVSERLAALGENSAGATTLRRPRPLKPPRWLMLASALLLIASGAWYALPHFPFAAKWYGALQPYSQAGAMQSGLQALTMWDRPGGLEKAERYFSVILAHNPDNAAAMAGLSAVYSMRYGTDHQDEIWLRKARAAAQQALRLNDQLAFSHAAMANVLRQEGHPEQALTSFERALSLDPQNIFALNNKISALRELRRFDEALRLARDNLRRFPNERVFADQIGTIYYAQGRYGDAEQAFRQSLQIQADAVVAYANLSAALAGQNKPEEALHVLQQGLQVRPSAWLYGNLGNTLFLQGDYAGAAAAFEAAVAPAKGNPADYLGWANLADTLLWIPGREADARTAYARASGLLAPRLARAPHDVTLLSHMSLYFARTGEKQQCEELLQQVLALAPDGADVQFRAGLAYELIGERKRALAAIARATRLGYPAKFIDAAPELVALRRDADYGSPR